MPLGRPPFGTSEIVGTVAETARFVPTPADDPAVIEMLGEYYHELDRRFEFGFDAHLTPQADVDETTPPRGVFLVVMVNSQPAGIGALRTERPGIGEIKRMYLRDICRGRGIGRALVAELETYALKFGMTETWLDSNRALGNAIAMYRSLGYTDIERYNHHPYGDVWLGRTLTR